MFHKNTIRIGLLCASLFSSIVFAQDYRNGYIINNSNDTIIGKIEYAPTEGYANICRFIEINSDIIIEYLSSQIKAYRYDNSKFFVAKELPINTEIRLVFAEYLLKGSINLYYFGERGQKHYYIEQVDGRITELTNEDIDIFVEGKGAYIHETNRHIGVLRYTFSDTPELFDDINNANLTHKSLIKISSDYHYLICNEGEECIVYEKPISKGRE